MLVSNSMQTYLGPPQLPSDDKRWKIVEATARRHGREPHALIETLHTVQEMLRLSGRDRTAIRGRHACACRSAASTAPPPSTISSPSSPRANTPAWSAPGRPATSRARPRCLQPSSNAHGIKPGETTADNELSRAHRALPGLLRTGAGGGDGWRGARQDRARRDARPHRERHPP